MFFGKKVVGLFQLEGLINNNIISFNKNYFQSIFYLYIVHQLVCLTLVSFDKAYSIFLTPTQHVTILITNDYVLLNISPLRP